MHRGPRSAREVLWMIGGMVRTAALISTVIFAILFVGQGLFPQFYPRPLALHHLPLLFAVAFLPRLLGWGLILAIDWFRRRKT